MHRKQSLLTLASPLIPLNCSGCFRMGSLILITAKAIKHQRTAGGDTWLMQVFVLHVRKRIFCSLQPPLGAWYPGLLAHSRCIITSNQAILQSTLPSGWMALWFLKCLRGLLQPRLEAFFQNLENLHFHNGTGVPRETGLFRSVRSFIQPNCSS